MKKNKKIIIIAVIAVVVLGATLGAVAVAQASDQPAATAASSNTTTIWDRVAAIYKTNTGTAIDSAALQKAFQQAQKDLATEARDKMLQKMVDSGKITQKQADDYKNWLNSMPGSALSDTFKQWLESKPAGIPFGPGMQAPAMPHGFGGIGKMFRRK
jgi:hypothetical protein